MIGLAYVELLLWVANVWAASDDTCTESGPLPQLVSYPDWKRRSSFAWMVFRKYVLLKLVAPFLIAAISRENFLLNIRHHTIDDFTCLTGNVIFLVTLNTMPLHMYMDYGKLHALSPPNWCALDEIHAHSFTRLDNHQLRTASRPF